MSLEKVLRRLSWAEGQLASLESQFAALRKAYRKPPLSKEVKKGGKVREYSIGDVPEIPPDLGLLVGDCVHNFRAAIDNLVYTIAEENNPSGLNSEERRAISFPINETQEGFREARSKGVIAKLPTRAQARIQRLQPYKRREHAQWRPLTILRKLSDTDKHRSVAIVAWNAQPFALNPPVPGARLEPLTDKLEPHTKFLRLRLPAEYAHMDVDIVFWVSLFIQEPEALRNRAADLWLSDIQDFIRGTVIQELARYCTAASPEALAEAYGVIEWHTPPPGFLR